MSARRDTAVETLAHHQWDPTVTDRCTCGQLPGDWSTQGKGDLLMAEHQMLMMEQAERLRVAVLTEEVVEPAEVEPADEAVASRICTCSHGYRQHSGLMDAFSWLGGCSACLCPAFTPSSLTTA